MLHQRQPSAAAPLACSRRHGETRPSMPGLHPGRVVAVKHPGSVVDAMRAAEPIQAMMRRGMQELTGAPDWVAAWRTFFEPGDVVGIKLNPVGRPYVLSSAEVVREIVAGLNAAGVPNEDIIAYDRYRNQFLEAGFDQWLPDGVRWTWAAERWDALQLGMDRHDERHFMELAVTQPGQDPRDPHMRRSYVAQFLTREVSKLINVPVLKHHQSAGVTLALKNLSHGLVNNVNRSHPEPTLNVCGRFIPAVVSIPVIRDKTVLHILDGIRGMYHGPGSRGAKYLWDHHTLYFATDPVALDKTGWKVIDDKRVRECRQPVALARPDEDSRSSRCQPEHIEIAGALGLGIFDDAKIRVENVTLG